MHWTLAQLLPILNIEGLLTLRIWLPVVEMVQASPAYGRCDCKHWANHRVSGSLTGSWYANRKLLGIYSLSLLRDWLLRPVFPPEFCIGLFSWWLTVLSSEFGWGGANSIPHTVGCVYTPMGTPFKNRTPSKIDSRCKWVGIWKISDAASESGLAYFTDVGPLRYMIQ